MITILDCFTDEPAGLGVPPYFGVYPRYIAGQLMDDGLDYKDIRYLTVDDLRLLKKHDLVIPETKKSQKTDISIRNLSENWKQAHKILEESDEIIVISGAHTSGKYLGSFPGDVKEVLRLLKDFKGRKYIAGPAASDFGTSFQGGKIERRSYHEFINENFDDVFRIETDYKKLRKLAVEGAKISEQAYKPFIAELETGHGCVRNPGCSFCTDPIKNKLESRDKEDILEEMKVLRKYTSYFRMGKQSCFYSYKQGNTKELEGLLKGASELKPKVLHIDNANPALVDEEKTKLIVKYCTPGNIAAFGVESFDPKVIKANNLNSDPERTYEAIRIINKYGAKRGKNGMPKFLPGINLLFGLIDENKETHEHNYKWLKKIYDDGLLVRRINIRQVIPFQGTMLYRLAGNKFLKKNKKYYWKWRNAIRQDIDFPMLQKVVPEGTILKNVLMEIYDGKHTFGIQIGTYPIIIGIKGRVELGKFYKIRVKKHNLRSIEGEVVE